MAQQPTLRRLSLATGTQPKSATRLLPSWHRPWTVPRGNLLASTVVHASWWCCWPQPRRRSRWHVPLSSFGPRLCRSPGCVVRHLPHLPRRESRWCISSESMRSGVRTPTECGRTGQSVLPIRRPCLVVFVDSAFSSSRHCASASMPSRPVLPSYMSCIGCREGMPGPEPNGHWFASMARQWLAWQYAAPPEGRDLSWMSGFDTASAGDGEQGFRPAAERQRGHMANDIAAGSRVRHADVEGTTVGRKIGSLPSPSSPLSILPRFQKHITLRPAFPARATGTRVVHSASHPPDRL